MPRQKKESNLIQIGNVNTAAGSKSNSISGSGNKSQSHKEIDSHIKIENHNYNPQSQTHRGKLNFKNSNFSSKFRIKERNSRVAKNVKNMVQDTLDSLSYNQYQGIEAGPSLLPKRKYCDITGFESNYTDPGTGLRYYDADIYKIVHTLTEPIKNQYLSMRKALFIIK